MCCGHFQITYPPSKLCRNKLVASTFVNQCKFRALDTPFRSTSNLFRRGRFPSLVNLTVIGPVHFSWWTSLTLLNAQQTHCRLMVFLWLSTVFEGINQRWSYWTQPKKESFCGLLLRRAAWKTVFVCFLLHSFWSSHSPADGIFLALFWKREIHFLLLSARHLLTDSSNKTRRFNQHTERKSSF